MIVLSYQQLLDRSDLAVIATPTTRTKDTTESSHLPGIFRQDATGVQSQISSIGVETAFKVSTVLKGERNIQAFVLHHYREAVPEVTGDGAAFLLIFDPGDISKRSSYLLFLVREPDGRYAPTGGQTDPGFKAVLKVQMD
ncbi:MAG TPA: hypothetical protein VNY05_26175 [Candidatus Acidoferrales bacterium]|jgi:hypothetical protein|nr:hypothetical protein [Candidatus Acidoferrales bacterium]